MHIGNYFGALANWVRLQNDGAYDCFYFIADWHSLTSDYADTSGIAQNVIEIATDYLAGGLDPEKHPHCTIFQQSLIPEHAELHLLLSMVTPLGWLERVPTYKEALENIKDKGLHNYGFLGYPVLQCGDIVMYGEPDAQLFVPVGEDQVSHVEISREIVRRFNTYYGLHIGSEIFAESNRKILRSLWTQTLQLSELPQKMGPGGDIAVEWAQLYERMIRERIFEIGFVNILGKLPSGSDWNNDGYLVHERRAAPRDGECHRGRARDRPEAARRKRRV
jgi:tryptophanyl-tRNA synthetase